MRFSYRPSAYRRAMKKRWRLLPGACTPLTFRIPAGVAWTEPPGTG